MKNCLVFSEAKKRRKETNDSTEEDAAADSKGMLNSFFNLNFLNRKKFRIHVQDKQKQREKSTFFNYFCDLLILKCIC